LHRHLLCHRNEIQSTFGNERPTTPSLGNEGEGGEGIGTKRVNYKIRQIDKNEYKPVMDDNNY